MIKNQLDDIRHAIAELEAEREKNDIIIDFLNTDQGSLFTQDHLIDLQAKNDVINEQIDDLRKKEKSLLNHPATRRRVERSTAELRTMAAQR